MEIEIGLPDYGSFTNKAGQLIEFWLDKEDKTKCKILVDGKPLDMAKFMEQEAAFNSHMEMLSKAGGVMNPTSNEKE